jgi:hypothetical protein
MSRNLVKDVAAAALLWAIAGPGAALAQAPMGIRAGASSDPGQFYVGAHIESGPLIREVRFRPNVEAGFGDNQTLIALNGEFIRRFGLEDGYAAYVGAGPSINIATSDTRFGNDTNVGPGLNFLIGLDFPPGVFAELKIGAIDSPEVKVGVGYTFP